MASPKPDGVDFPLTRSVLLRRRVNGAREVGNDSKNGSGRATRSGTGRGAFPGRRDEARRPPEGDICSRDYARETFLKVAV